MVLQARIAVAPTHKRQAVRSASLLRIGTGERQRCRHCSLFKDRASRWIADSPLFAASTVAPRLPRGSGDAR
jgi:hypothetical protein